MVLGMQIAALIRSEADQKDLEKDKKEITSLKPLLTGAELGF